jgi:membrane associated rhomboid family serine protease
MFPLRDNIPTRRRPVMTWTLMAVTSGVYLLESLLHPEHLQEIAYLFGIVPARFTHPEWAVRVGFPIDDYWPFLTTIFLHAGLVHLASNMWFLWIFGDNVEDRMGRGRFLAFYLLCGVVAGLVHTWTNSHSIVPAVGASGAIAGVLGAYVVLYPRSRVETLVMLVFWPLIVDVPGVFYVVYWFAIQLLNGTAALLGPEQMGGVAWWAHIGGFASGIALVRLFVNGVASRPRPHRVAA